MSSINMGQHEDCNLIDPLSIPLPEDIPEPHLPLEEIPPPPSPIPVQTSTTTNNLPTKSSSESIKHKFEESTPSIKSSRHKRRKFDHDEKLEEEKELMARMLGFSEFDSTKGKHVPGNNLIGAVHVVKKRRYRQYMNRKGGFNRPLDKVA